MTPIITVSNLTKNYGRSRGVTGLSFEVNEGEVFGFLAIGALRFQRSDVRSGV